MKYFQQSTKRVPQIFWILIIVFAGLMFAPFTSGEPKPSGTVSRPIRTSVGGSRGTCYEVFPPLTALVPLSVAQTVSERPTFWFYSPYKGQSLQANFILQKDNKNISSMTVTLPEEPGFVRVRPTGEPLQPNENYQWFFEIVCAGAGQPTETVEGSIQRITATLPANGRSQTGLPQTQSLSNESDAQLFDAIATLAERRLKQPQDPRLLEEWQGLLRSLKFELERKPLTPEQVKAMGASPLNP